jgi:hypothetical protein
MFDSLSVRRVWAALHLHYNALIAARSFFALATTRLAAARLFMGTDDAII